ncbi:hypothetical protein [uncultured Nostoc sp.]|uniref:hypothetical protein n=1 Tax=uncultured Nostoc sp. TaxID=340711 RepID=UPI0035CC8877
MALYNPPSVTVITPSSTTSTPTTVPAATTSNTILAPNTNRIGMTIWNYSTANLYIEFGATASTSAFLARISPSGYYELPFRYTGVISGIWDAANGSALVRELT